MHLHGRRSWAEVNFNATDLRSEEIKEMYRRLRSVPNVRRQRVNPLHFRLWQIVEESGIPVTGKSAFWESVRRRLYEEGTHCVPGTWQAVRKAYLEFQAEHGAAAPDHVEGRN